jgi:hypothetical protein
MQLRDQRSKQLISDALIDEESEGWSTSGKLNGAARRALSCWPAHARSPGFEHLI